MFSIAARHKEKVRQRLVAQKASRANDIDNLTHKQVSELRSHLQQPVIEKELDLDLERLSAINEIAKKIDLKREVLLPKYMPIVESYMSSGARIQNDLLGYTVAWLIDVERIEEAIQIAIFAIEQQQHMPERFKRDFATYTAEEVCSWCEAQFKKQASASPYLERITALVDAKTWLITNVIVLNKIHRLNALVAESKKDYKTAVMFYEQCEKENPSKSGVKTRLAAAKKLAEL